MMNRVVLGVTFSLAGMFTACAADIPTGAVAAYWRFNDATDVGADSGAYGSRLTDLSAVTPESRDSGYASGKKRTYDDSGCLHIATAGAKAVGKINGWNPSKGYTIVLKFRSECTIDASDVQGRDENVYNLMKTVSDDKSWHFMAFRYDPDKLTGGGDSRYKYWLFADYSDEGAGDRAEAAADENVYFPVSVADDGTVSVGGRIGEGLC